MQGWTAVGSPGFSASKALDVSLALDPTTGAPYVAITQPEDSGTVDSDDEPIMFKRPIVYTVTGGSWSAVGSYFSANSALFISLALHPNTSAPFVAYSDVGQSNRATVKTYSQGGWSIVGVAGFSDDKADYTSLALHPTTGVPYVAYQDWFGGTGKATVMMFSSGAWSPVGVPRFSPLQAVHPTLALDRTGAPVVAYSDSSNNGKATVMTLRNNVWSPVGNSGFSSGKAGTLSLALHPASGAPYVAFRDESLNAGYGNATVMTFNGTHWPSLGSPGSASDWLPQPSNIYTHNIYTLSLALNPSTGAPYLAFVESQGLWAVGSNGIKYYFFNSPATVVTFAGGSWSAVGSPRLSSWANYLKLALHPTTGAPYVAYSDGMGLATYSKATVMAYL